MGDSRGSIACFATYRPPVPLDIYSCPADPPPSSRDDEVLLTDGKSYNHNCRPIPAAALMELLTFLDRKNPKLAKEMVYTPADAATGVATGLVFVSERDKGLETLHVALRGDKQRPPVVRRLADIYGAETFGGVRLEDSGCFAGGFLVGGRTVSHSIVYVSTKEPVSTRRSPWTVVYKTNLANGKTERLTPHGQYDMSPAVSPSGKMVAVANFQFNRWNGEIEHLKTDIVIMNVDRQAQGALRRKIVIEDGGWPTWGSDNVIFFHRGVDKKGDDGKVKITWGVFQYNIQTNKTDRVTPENFDAMTPAAISETKVAVATIRQKSMQAALTAPRVEAQYRHIEIFDVTARERPVEITRKAIPKADHYNPFILDGGKRIGFHRCRTEEFVENGSVIPKNFHKLLSPESHKDVGLFRVSGVFPTISTDGLKLAFVDNEFKAVWLADSNGLRVIYDKKDSNKIFSTVWNQNRNEDTLYICVGPAFSIDQPLEIFAIFNASTTKTNVRRVSRLTNGNFNNAFPSSNPEGTKFVFRSSCDRRPGVDNPTDWKVGERKRKNLFIMENAEVGEFGGGTVTRLTDGEWTDTHCSWSPQGDWIVFSSTRDKPPGAEDLDNGLDPGYFAVYLVKATDKKVVRVIRSGVTLAGHVNHPMFSPDMKSIVVTSDLAAVTAEPISLPIFVHSVRPYGDIFAVNLRVFDTNEDIAKNEDINEFHRITHSRYEYSTPTWTRSDTVDPNAKWNIGNATGASFSPKCPYMQGDGGESWHMAGHLTIGKRCC